MGALTPSRPVGGTRWDRCQPHLRPRSEKQSRRPQKLNTAPPKLTTATPGVAQMRTQSSGFPSFGPSSSNCPGCSGPPPPAGNHARVSSCVTGKHGQTTALYWVQKAPTFAWIQLYSTACRDGMCLLQAVSPSCAPSRREKEILAAPMAVVTKAYRHRPSAPGQRPSCASLPPLGCRSLPGEILCLVHKANLPAGSLEGLIRGTRNGAKRESRFPASGRVLFVVHKKEK